METSRARGLFTGLLAASAVLLIATSSVAAQPLRGLLDRSFGENGHVVSALGDAFGSSEFTSMVRQPDGKLVLTARIETANGEVEVVERRLPTGALDPGFGTGGVLQVSVPPGFDGPSGMTIDAEGRILFAVSEPEDCPGCITTGGATIHRLLPDGSPDHSFGTDGVSAPIVPFSASYLAVDGQGRILVAGERHHCPCGKGGPPFTYLGVARLLPNGSLDPGFGNGGVVDTHTDDGLGESSPTGLSIGDGGRIFVGGYPFVLALTGDGHPDPSFGSGGLVKTANAPRALIATSAGVVVASSTSSFATKSSVVLSRYRMDGGLDPGFGTGGRVTFAGDAENDAVALALAPDGSIVLAGATAPAGCLLDYECDFTPIVARFTPFGALDTGFAGVGWEPIEPPDATPGKASGITAVTVAPSGQIVAAGGDFDHGDAYVVARAPSGGPDSSFGNGGSIDEVRMLPSKTHALGLGVGSKGRMVVAAWSDTGAHLAHPILLGVAPDGTFGGQLTAKAKDVDAGIDDQLQADQRGRFYVVLPPRSHGSARLARIMPDGRPDLSYGSGGIAIVPHGFRISSFLVRPNGRVVAVGGAKRVDAMAVFELTPAGHIDRRFGRHGVALASCGAETTCEGESAAVDGQGRIVLAGEINTGDIVVVEHPGVFRLLPDGRPDKSFGRRGRRRLREEVSFEGKVIVTVQQHRKIVLAIGPEDGGIGGKTLLLRFTPGGRLDAGFGRHGVVWVPGKPLSLFAGRRRILMMTTRGRDDDRGVALRAYLPGGAIDRGFGHGGVAIGRAVGNRPFEPVAVARQPSGRIVVLGTVDVDKYSDDTPAEVELLRFR
jgi:uncharacterized delta-60 repeat protein